MHVLISGTHPFFFNKTIKKLWNIEIVKDSNWKEYIDCHLCGDNEENKSITINSAIKRKKIICKRKYAYMKRRKLTSQKTHTCTCNIGCREIIHNKIEIRLTYSHHFKSIANTHATHAGKRALAGDSSYMYTVHVGVYSHSLYTNNQLLLITWRHMAEKQVSLLENPADEEHYGRADSTGQPRQLPTVIDAMEPSCGNCRKKYRLLRGTFMM